MEAFVFEGDSNSIGLHLDAKDGLTEAVVSKFYHEQKESFRETIESIPGVFNVGLICDPYNKRIEIQVIKDKMAEVWDGIVDKCVLAVCKHIPTACPSQLACNQE